MHLSYPSIDLKSSQTRHKPPFQAVLAAGRAGWSPLITGSCGLVRDADAHLFGMATSFPEPTNRLERLLTIQELSDYLGIPVKTLYYWRAQRVGPRAVTVGRALRYPESAIVTWLSEQS